MSNKIKNIVVTVVFSLFLAVFFVLCVAQKPVAVSEAERRPLSQLPDFSVSGVLDGSNISDFEKYTVDQFPFRDSFRSLKAMFSLNFLFRQDNNGYHVSDGVIFKNDYPLDEDSVAHAADRINNIINKFLTSGNHNVIYSIVPDKSYFAADGYPSIDYKKLEALMAEKLEGDISYVDIFGCLELGDYYATDTHWSQDKLSEVVKALGDALGVSDSLSVEYTIKKLYPFYGVYSGQSALKTDPDTIFYLTNEVIENCTVFSYETGKTTSVYDLDKFNGSDPYEIFLSGSMPLIRIDNPANTSGRELIVFRDSFGSSLVPLLLEGYSSVTVVDLRYVNNPAALGSLIDFSGSQDVLFLYSTIVLNNSYSIR